MQNRAIEIWSSQDQDKAQIRKMALRRRNSIALEDRERWSWEIQDRIRHSVWYQNAKTVLSYASFRSEVMTDQINEWILQDGKYLYLPHTDSDRHEMMFYRVRDLTALVPGYQGIREPEEQERWTPLPEEPGSVLMIMPGAAYDHYGSRIGYGGGYYDQYLRRYGHRITKTVMLAFMAQQVSEVPCESWDISPDQIVTEEGYIL